jgi:endonuclease/exonuclease/phosphatase family metal-dependent hydrolase
MAALLEEEVVPQTTPVILAGDLNAPEHSQPYALVAAHLENAHRAAGSGLGFTYPSSAVRLLGAVPAFPVVRIDHVFFSRHFVALRADTLEDSGGSDHRPVLAVLALAASGEPGRRASR